MSPPIFDEIRENRFEMFRACFRKRKYRSSESDKGNEGRRFERNKYKQQEMVWCDIEGYEGVASMHKDARIEWNERLAFDFDFNNK